MPVWYKWVPHVQAERCLACGLCGRVCPHGCLEVVDGAGAMVKPEACASEALCVGACPERAITVRWMRLDGDHSVGRWRMRSVRRRRPVMAGVE